MKIRHLLPALTLGLLPVATISAQTPPPPPAEEGQKPNKTPRDPKEMAAKRIEGMTKALNLTEDQSAKIKQIFEDNAPAMKALREDSSLSKEQKHEKAKALKTEIDSKISAVLTPEQNAKWQEQREQMKQKRDKGGPGAESHPAASPTATPN